MATCGALGIADRPRSGFVARAWSQHVASAPRSLGAEPSGGFTGVLGLGADVIVLRAAKDRKYALVELLREVVENGPTPRLLARA